MKVIFRIWFLFFAIAFFSFGFWAMGALSNSLVANQLGDFPNLKIFGYGLLFSLLSSAAVMLPVMLVLIVCRLIFDRGNDE